jgi:hypothetical protein
MPLDAIVLMKAIDWIKSDIIKGVQNVVGPDSTKPEPFPIMEMSLSQWRNHLRTCYPAWLRFDSSNELESLEDRDSEDSDSDSEESKSWDQEVPTEDLMIAEEESVSIREEVLDAIQGHMEEVYFQV